MEFLSTPSARRATGRCVQLLNQRIISIHALREEGDRVGRLYFAAVGIFLSTPSARRATSGLFTLMFGAGFLSTPSARRATYRPWTGGSCRCDFYPRPPRGGRPQGAFVGPGKVQISIHALREEGDLVSFWGCCPATISIHALREEGDFSSPPSLVSRSNFYPRPPRGGRQIIRHTGNDGLRISIHALREDASAG